MTQQQIIEILKQFEPYLHQAGILNNILRDFGWVIIKLLVMLLDSVESMLDMFYGLFNFFEYPEVSEFIDSFRPVLWVLFAISLAALGIQLIIQGKENRSHIVTNIIVAVMILTALPNVMTALNDFTLAGIEFVNPEYSSTANEIIADNITDILLIPEMTADDLKEHPNNLSIDTISHININGVVYPENVTGDYRDIYENRLSVDDAGNETVEEIKAPLLGIEMLSTYYYRWDMDFFTVLMSLAAMCIAMFFTCYKVIRLLYEIAIHGFLAALSSVTDISGGARTKMIVKSLFSSFAVAFLTVVFLKFYMMASNYFAANLSGLPLAFALLFAAICVVDGPNIVERILGIDAGLSSGVRSMAAMMHAAGTAGRAAGKLGRTVVNAAGTAAAAAGAAGGFASAFTGSSHSSESNSRNEENNNNYESSHDSDRKEGQQYSEGIRQSEYASSASSRSEDSESPRQYGAGERQTPAAETPLFTGSDFSEADIDSGRRDQNRHTMVDDELTRTVNNMSENLDALTRQSEQRQRRAGAGLFRQQAYKVTDSTKRGHSAGQRFAERQNRRRNKK